MRNLFLALKCALTKPQYVLEAVQSYNHTQIFENRLNRLYDAQLIPYSYADCFEAVWIHRRRLGLFSEDIGKLVEVLRARSGRGSTTIEDVLKNF